MSTIIAINTRNGNTLQLVANKAVAEECVRISYSAYATAKFTVHTHGMTVETPDGTTEFFFREMEVWDTPDHL